MDHRSVRGEATRQAIIGTATRLFAAHGYEATSTDLVLRECAVSRGALYHHFSSKEALFTAVLEAAEAGVAAKISTAAGGAPNPLEALRAGCAAWLALSDDPVVKQIVLIDAPAVIGWQAWRAIDDRYALGLIKSALASAAAQGRVPATLVECYAHMLLAMLIELALFIARAQDPKTAAEDAAQAVEQILSRFAGVAPFAAW
jgi:AcrR family transcriptional regulator